MIFATVGTQLPFDRLIGALDDWAVTHPDVEVFAQVGRGTLLPRNIQWTHDMHPATFRARIEACETVVAHAGMGTIITAIELGKRVIVMPRRAALGEHRNEHQLATVARLAHLRGLEVAHSPAELAALLDSSRATGPLAAPSGADARLIVTIRQFAGLQAA
jgi:UDP-N-acetylglucosamine transferase subunit ALG13